MSENRKNRDKEMAATLKKRGDRRTSGNCPICHRLVALNHFPTHLFKCVGRRKA
jgi:nitrate/TMAO reductase-like tetraheme cytochrome c subunit